MKKVFCVWVIIITALFTSGADSFAVLVDLNEQNIRDALAFDSMHKGTASKELDRLYCIDKKDGYGEYVTVRTKWHKLARMSSVCSLQKKGVPDEIRDEILNNTLLQIDVTVYGFSMDFARGYKVFIEQDGKKINPEKIHADHSKNVEQTMKHHSGFPQYRAVIRSYFSYKNINPDGMANLVLVKDNRSKTFMINFGGYK